MRTLVACVTALLSASAFAAPAPPPAEPGTHYTLYQGAVAFSAPVQWPAGMQKTSGTPQFVAFLLKDPAGDGNASELSVEARVINDASTFQSLVNAGTDKAKQTPGFQALSSGNVTVLHYAALNGKVRFDYQETWYLDSKILIHVHCSRPTTASASWASSFDAGCAQVMRTAKPH